MKIQIPLGLLGRFLITCARSAIKVGQLRRSLTDKCMLTFGEKMSKVFQHCKTFAERLGFRPDHVTNRAELF